MDEKRLVKISKFLAKYLRHEPEQLGLTLSPGGWVPVDALLNACRERNFALSRAELDEVVAKNNKQRFSFDPTGMLIRANQGHSTEVDLQLAPSAPPDVLYHGTGRASIEAIRQQGISKMSRHHVHLSADVETAVNVGSRHGVPFVFHIDARQMHAEGYLFYRSSNGVWLVEHVPTTYLLNLSDDAGSSENSAD
ncbi:MAG: RNA 2'-phosphotransferase [Chloroflexota bacterium]